MSIFNSNDYNRGYQNGHKDAMAGKEKSYVAAGMSWKYAVHGNSAFDSYVKGYDEGYRIGMRDRCRGGNK